MQVKRLALKNGEIYMKKKSGKSIKEGSDKEVVYVSLVDCLSLSTNIL